MNLVELMRPFICGNYSGLLDKEVVERQLNDLPAILGLLLNNRLFCIMSVMSVLFWLHDVLGL